MLVADLGWHVTHAPLCRWAVFIGMVIAGADWLWEKATT